MKKAFTIILIVMLVFLCACGDEKSSQSNQDGGGNGLTTNGDIIAESQQTRQSLNESIQRARAILDARESTGDYSGKYLSGYSVSNEYDEYEEEPLEETLYDDTNENNDISSTTRESNETAKSNEPPPLPTNAGKYTPVTVGKLYGELNENAMRAENNWNDKYVVIAGYISNIDNDGAYFGITDTDEAWDFEQVHCDMKKNEQAKSLIMSQNIGDGVLVYGKITSIGEVIGYSVDVDKVEGNNTNSVKTNTTKATNGKYTVTTVGELLNDLGSNAMRAESEWKDKDVQVTGYLYVIDSDGSYFSMTDAPDEYGSIHVSMKKNDNVKNVIINKNTGDRVVVKGKITVVGEVLGITVDAESAE